MKIKPNFVKIALTKGKYSLIDIEDFERVSKYKWYYSPNGYAVRTCYKGKRKLIGLHRFILDAPNGLMVDHINHNKLDNRKKNLRLVTNSQNQHNQVNKCRGVCFCKYANKFKAYITVNKITIHLGNFTDKEEALKNVKRARKAYIKY